MEYKKTSILHVLAVLSQLGWASDFVLAENTGLIDSQGRLLPDNGMTEITSEDVRRFCETSGCTELYERAHLHDLVAHLIILGHEVPLEAYDPNLT